MTPPAETPPGNNPTPLQTQSVLPLTSPIAVTPTPGSHLGVTPDQLHGARVHFWHAWTGAQADLLKQMVSEFNGTNPYGIWVESTQIGNYAGLQEQLGTALKSNTAPDLVAAYLEQALTWTNRVVDLTPYVRDSRYGLSESEISDFWPSLWDRGTIDGKQIGIPAAFDANILYYNISWANQLGFNEPPVTPQDFNQQVCAAGQANRNDNSTENDGMGGWIISSDPLTMLNWMAAFEGTVSQDGGATYSFNTKESNHAWAYLRDLTDKGCAWLARNPDPTGYFAHREALAYSGSLQEIAKQAQANQAAGSSDEWTIIPYPGGKENRSFYVEGPYYEILSSGSTERLAAWLFLRWLEQPENQARLALAGGTLPSGKTAFSNMQPSLSGQPQWGTIEGMVDRARIDLYRPSWMTVRFILQDAAKQLFQPEIQTDQVGKILSELDQTTSEVLSQQP